MNPKPDTRNQILNAALEAFAENGYDKTSMDDLVKRTGLSKGSLYWHFKNKHELLLAVIDMAMSGFKESMQQIADSDLPASERLRFSFTESIKAFTDNPTFTGLLVNFFFQSSQSPDAQEIMRASYEFYVAMVDKMLQDGIEGGEFRPLDTRKTAIMLIGAGDGVIFQTLLNPEWDVIDIMQTLLDVLLHGLRKETPES